MNIDVHEDPEFSTELVDGTLVVHLVRRAGLTDDELFRLARKQAGVLAPVRVFLDDEAQRRSLRVEEYHHDGQVLLPLKRQQVVRMLFRRDLDTVFTVAAAYPATDEQRARVARANPQHAEWVHKGGGLLAIEMTDGNEVVVPAHYAYGARSGIWMIPETDHWPRCVDCREPWPCTDHRREADAERAAGWERMRCTHCGQTDGNTFEFRKADGFPERRLYHTRKGPCLAVAIRYANEHGWIMVEGGGWRTFRRAPDDMPRPLAQRVTPGPKRRQTGKVHFGVPAADDDERTVPMCGAKVEAPAFGGTREAVTCQRCLTLDS